MSGNTRDAKDEAILLESELILARKPIIYFIFNLKDRVVQLKSRGIVLKEMKVEKVTFWGDPVDTKPRTMIKKSTLFEPKREKIDPNKNKAEETTTTTTGAFNIDALELKDMPASYRVKFSGGVSVSVRPNRTGFISIFYRSGNLLGWYVTRPILTVWNSILGKPFTSLYLILDKEDARSIYWSLTEKSENIIFQP